MFVYGDFYDMAGFTEWHCSWLQASPARGARPCWRSQRQGSGRAAAGQEGHGRAGLGGATYARDANSSNVVMTRTDLIREEGVGGGSSW